MVSSKKIRASTGEVGKTDIETPRAEANQIPAKTVAGSRRCRSERKPLAKGIESIIKEREIRTRWPVNRGVPAKTNAANAVSG
jgi:hypothetical protein